MSVKTDLLIVKAILLFAIIAVAVVASKDPLMRLLALPAPAGPSSYVGSGKVTTGPAVDDEKLARDRRDWGLVLEGAQAERERTSKLRPTTFFVKRCFEMSGGCGSYECINMDTMKLCVLICPTDVFGSAGSAGTKITLLAVYQGEKPTTYVLTNTHTGARTESIEYFPTYYKVRSVEEIDKHIEELTAKINGTGK